MTTTTATLESEIRAAFNSVRNGLSTRANHPTYGVTKASLLATYNRLEGLIIAHRIVADPNCPPNPGAVVGNYAYDVLGIPLNTLHDDIRGA